MNNRDLVALAVCLTLGGLLAGCVRAQPTAASGSPTLKDAFKGSFLIGAALNQAQFTGQDVRSVALIKAQFNSVTPENALKWASIHPRRDEYDFKAADQYVEFGEQNGMFIVGHTLIWHSQTPRWVFLDDDGKPVDRETLLERMRDHIHTVVGRYMGRVKGWDVVNEALNDDGTLRRSPWMRIIGEDYLLKAYEFAHEADPDAELYYNDFSIENEPKRNGAIRLLKRLQAAGVPVSAVGIQEHAKMDWPSPQLLDETITAFSAFGLKVMITELDVDVLPAATRNRGAEISLRVAGNAALNPYTNGLPESVQQALAKRYAELFGVYLKHRDAISRVTFWGVTDRESWLNNWPVRGRTAYPLLFDRDYLPKPAFEAVINTAQP